MKTKTAATAILLLIIALQTLTLTNFTSAAEEPVNLKVYIGPASVPADNRTYNVIAVQLQDSKNLPAKAEEDTLIGLSSSSTSVGTVQTSITILKGETYADAWFHSTFTPGSTTITAASSGYTTVQATISTIGPVPSTLAVYAFPPVLPTDGNSYPAIVVQLQDSGGNPARAPLEGLPVTLSCSNIEVGRVDASVTIKGGETFAVANFRTTSRDGTANVIAVASGYSSKQTTIKTQNYSMSSEDCSLKVYVGPAKMMADGITYQNVVAVQLQDSSGTLVRASGKVQVALSSSNTNVGTIDASATVENYRNYALASFYSTYTSGTTTIIAAATNYKSNEQTLTTIGPVPSKLAVYCVPSVVPANGQPSDSIRVQLQDSKGTPAKDPVGNITVYLFSSEPDCGNVTQTLTIPYGETHASGAFTPTCSANTTTITAQSSGYDSGQAKITTALIDEFSLSVNVTAELTALYTGNQSIIKAYVTYNGTIPAPGAKVTFKSNRGGSFSPVVDSADGYYTTVFTAGDAQNNAVCTVTVEAVKTSYSATSGKVLLTLNPSSIRTGTLLLHVTDDNGDALAEANVAAVIESSGETSFNGVTNDTGYITLANILEGTYILQVTKNGYVTTNETVTISSGDSISRMVVLSPSPGLPLLIIIPAVVAVAAVAVVYWQVKKRRNTTAEEEEEFF